MRNAEYIVDYLLEATSKGTTLRFGPGDDPYGEEFFSFEDALDGNWEDEMLSNGYSFATLKNPGDVGVYSTKPKIGTMERGIELITHVFGIKPETLVHFSNKSGTPGKAIPLKDVFRERPMYRKSGEPEPEPEAESEPDDQPLDFGMEVDLDTVSQDGMSISHIVPGGPADQVGLQRGDRITMVEFENSTGYWGPYAIKTVDNFKFLLPFMELGYHIGLKYVRGGHEHPAGITPVKQTSSAQPVAKAQVADPFQRAWTSMIQDKTDLPSLTVGELAQYHRITAKQVVQILNKMGARARDYVPRAQQPNERDPASLTGNQPANPSALT